MEKRIYNFSAGPAVLPHSVLEEAQRDLLALPGIGMSILEISHRSKPFQKILDETKQNIKTLLKLPDDYHVLFLQGGASLQFSMIPMNFLSEGKSADYVVTGSWGKKAVADAVKLGKPHVVWSGESQKFHRLPTLDELTIDPNSAYVHLTSNETIEGLQFPELPDLGKIPVIYDMSSDFLSRPIDPRRYAMIYAGAQKNAGPAGVTIVILRDDLLKSANPNLTKMLSYQTHVDNDSLYNTPPTFAIYLVMLVTRWLLKDVGGLDKMAALNASKAKMLYEAMDTSNGFYAGCVAPEGRSKMNVTFRLPTETLEAEFVESARKLGLQELKGHRSVGGIRASIYNAMSADGVIALRDFMKEFKNQKAIG